MNEWTVFFSFIASFILSSVFYFKSIYFCDFRSPFDTLQWATEKKTNQQIILWFPLFNFTLIANFLVAIYLSNGLIHLCDMCDPKLQFTHNYRTHYRNITVFLWCYCCCFQCVCVLRINCVFLCFALIACFVQSFTAIFYTFCSMFIEFFFGQYFTNPNN